jgi:hypothetical protein
MYPSAPAASPASTSIKSECTVTNTMRAFGLAPELGDRLDAVDTRHGHVDDIR